MSCAVLVQPIHRSHGLGDLSETRRPKVSSGSRAQARHSRQVGVVKYRPSCWGRRAIPVIPFRRTVSMNSASAGTASSNSLARRRAGFTPPTCTAIRSWSRCSEATSARRVPRLSLRANRLSALRPLRVTLARSPGKCRTGFGTQHLSQAAAFPPHRPIRSPEAKATERLEDQDLSKTEMPRRQGKVHGYCDHNAGNKAQAGAVPPRGGHRPGPVQENADPQRHHDHEHHDEQEAL